MDRTNIRNFCIISHIDHGKSTLADRMLELTKTVEKYKMKKQFLDQMDIERERGITIKLQPVRMIYKIQNRSYILNLIDTPGHIDFNYEVSRSLAAVEGAILLVDASQGIQAQTLANLYLAIEQNLTIIPVINKIDLPAANISKTTKEIAKLIKDKALLASAKTGEGVDDILKTIVEKIPAPTGDVNKPLRALIFDSIYDEYKGVIAYVRVVDGKVKRGDKIKIFASNDQSETLEVGIFAPNYMPVKELRSGEIGYIITGLKNVEQCSVGDTITLAKHKDQDENFKIIPLQGYRKPKPMVFSGIYPQQGNDYQQLKNAIEKLKLNDASLTYQYEQSIALGQGFRCGFLGLLHLEIFQERLKREYNLNIIITTPSIAYKATLNKAVKKQSKVNDLETIIVHSPLELPNVSQIKKIEEPWLALNIITPKDYLGKVMELIKAKRGVYSNLEYLDQSRVILYYKSPMSAILTDFYNKLKSVSQGYASVNYEFSHYQQADIVKLDILIAEEIVEPLTVLVYKDEAYRKAREILSALKKTVPRQLFEVKLQAVLGGKIIASERIPQLRKDVTAKLYGGDVTRKRKLLEKQKKGKKKMKLLGKGRVNIPSEVFLAVLKQ